eukprot:TRINITY_DN22295_c0_g1_i1.p1 TRINITY_DN22295_c0_g1~~TRINITY_DN22295_c0_g1_i1.p1  ORF type:complete len:462 (-),score=98.22 TRINITY_DN22295_c0_g1_i1:110-1495(-)
MEKTAVTCVCWVPRGKSRPRPLNEEDNDEELKRAHDEMMGAGSSSTAKAAATAKAVAGGDGLDEFNLDRYDDSDDDGGMQLFSVLQEDGALAREKDPHMTGDADSESDSDGDNEIGPNDQVFIAASCEEDCCNLEMYVYDESEAGMYVHHEIMLGAYPLCLEWLSSTAKTAEGSFAALGLIDHSIQIWDLDSLDPVEPVQLLGISKKKTKIKSKKKKAPLAPVLDDVEAVAHDGAVLCLNGSVFNRNVLMSGGADHVVKVWDIVENNCVHAYAHHEDKVQCGRWHPTEQAVLLSASFDRSLALLDVRQPNACAKAELPAEAECAIWSRHQPFECIASADNGSVACYDVRKIVSKAPAAEQMLWTIHAHDAACTAVQDAPAPGLLVTTGLEGEAKVWKMGGMQPTMVFAKDLHAGPIFACHAVADTPATMCFGGKCPVIWDLSSEQLLTDAFCLSTPTPEAV